MDYFVTLPYLSKHLILKFQIWAVVIAAFTLVMGVTNLFSISVKKILAQDKGWHGKVALILSFIVTMVAGLWGGSNGAVFSYIFSNIYIPITSTVLALLLFFTVHAVIKSYSLHGFKAIVISLSAAATIVVNLFLVGYYPTIKEIIDRFFLLPAVRGFVIGVSLSAVVICIRTIIDGREEFLN
ncbi:hypothetical protein PRVXH_002431 [Proteinivorax hydrogeniformans]|uniref:Uncharacterized protein n=1 Tax=Proteinivorax hydrogeniformans TaxID=1826727 RepID=A0AAU8HSE0_9FIRM